MMIASYVFVILFLVTQRRLAFTLTPYGPQPSLGGASIHWCRRSALAPARRRRMMQPRLRNERPHLAAKALQADFLVAQRAHREATRVHPRLDAGAADGILGLHLTVEPPVDISRGLHPIGRAAVRKRVVRDGITLWGG